VLRASVSSSVKEAKSSTPQHHPGASAVGMTPRVLAPQPLQCSLMGPLPPDLQVQTKGRDYSHYSRVRHGVCVEPVTLRAVVKVLYTLSTVLHTVVT
jgi:hypothetical protein